MTGTLAPLAASVQVMLSIAVGPPPARASHQPRTAPSRAAARPTGIAGQRAGTGSLPHKPNAALLRATGRSSRAATVICRRVMGRGRPTESERFALERLVGTPLAARLAGLATREHGSFNRAAVSFTAAWFGGDACRFAEAVRRDLQLRFRRGYRYWNTIDIDERAVDALYIRRTDCCLLRVLLVLRTDGVYAEGLASEVNYLAVHCPVAVLSCVRRSASEAALLAEDLGGEYEVDELGPIFARMRMVKEPPAWYLPLLARIARRARTVAAGAG